MEINMSKINETIAAIKAEYEQRLAEKEAENAILRGEKKIAAEKAKQAAQEYEDYLNEYISVKLFKDNDRYKDDVYVAVNGYSGDGAGSLKAVCQGTYSVSAGGSTGNIDLKLKISYRAGNLIKEGCL